MVTWTQIHSDEAVLYSRKFYAGGTFNVTVPDGPGGHSAAVWLRAHALGCGGQGDHWGGSGARARSRVRVMPGDNLVIQCGLTSTATTIGDSWVKRNDGSVICYADRGRGNGNGGLASNSQGDVKFDGMAGSGGHGGSPSSDAADYAPAGFGGTGYDISVPRSADYGGGGLIRTDVDETGQGIVVGAYGGGLGLVCLEFFDSDPGY